MEKSLEQMKQEWLSKNKVTKGQDYDNGYRHKKRTDQSYDELHQNKRYCEVQKNGLVKTNEKTKRLAQGAIGTLKNYRLEEKDHIIGFQFAYNKRGLFQDERVIVKKTEAVKSGSGVIYARYIDDRGKAWKKKDIIKKIKDTSPKRYALIKESLSV